MAQDYERQTEELCQLFSKTLHSLASDAAAVRQLSSLAKVTGIENAQPNVMSIVDDDNETMKGLRNLDTAVTAMEQKVIALRSIVVEEKKAIAKFEGTLKGEAEAQSIALETMMQACNEMESQLQDEPAEEATSRQAGILRRDSVDPRKMNEIIHEEQDENDEEEEEEEVEEEDLESYSNKIRFLPVTASELKGFSRNYLGRIHLLDLNEALEEIELVIEMKFDSLPLKSAPSFNTLPSTLQRRYEFLESRRGNVDDEEVEAHAGYYWVSEQELRESCMFFRDGESTARAILTVLCSLRRLKQVPGKNRQVTYLCLIQDDQEFEEE